MGAVKHLERTGFSVARVVGASHVAPDGRLRYSAIVDLLQDCEGFQLDGVAGFRRYLRDNKVGMFLTSRQIDIKRLPVYGEELTVTTDVYEFKTVYGFRNTNIWGGDGALRICTCASGAFVDLNTGRPCRVPAEIVGAFDMRERFDMEYLPRKITLPDGKWEKLGGFKIPRYLLDGYNHVNNARYLDLAQEFLPADLSADRIRAEYRVPAALNDAVSVFSRSAGGSVTVDLRGEKGSYAVVEYTGCEQNGYFE